MWTWGLHLLMLCHQPIFKFYLLGISKHCLRALAMLGCFLATGLPWMCVQLICTAQRVFCLGQGMMSVQSGKGCLSPFPHKGSPGLKFIVFWQYRYFKNSCMLTLVVHQLECFLQEQQKSQLIKTNVYSFILYSLNVGQQTGQCPEKGISFSRIGNVF